MAVADRHDLAPFPTARRTDSRASFFAPANVASTKASDRSILPLVSQVFRETLEQQFQAAGPLPQLEASMTDLVRRIPARQIVPWGAGP
jgi:hypothetical protein